MRMNVIAFKSLAWIPPLKCPDETLTIYVISLLFNMKVGSDAAALDLSDALDRQENWGSDPAIQTIAMDHIKIVHKVREDDWPIL